MPGLCHVNLLSLLEPVWRLSTVYYPVIIMRRLFKFNWIYFVLAVILFAIEILIAKYVHDQIVRPYIGDVLVVILIYCFVKSFLNISVLKAAILVLLFAFSIESSQYLNLIEILGLQNSKMTKTILGNSFSWVDILTYIAGIACVLLIEFLTKKNIAK